MVYWHQVAITTSLSNHPLQESSENRRVLCANILLDRWIHSPKDFQRNLQLVQGWWFEAGGIPKFRPGRSVLLQTMKPEDSGKEYEVTIKKAWPSGGAAKLCSQVDGHGVQRPDDHRAWESQPKRYNPGGEYWHETERRGWVWYPDLGRKMYQYLI